MASTTYLQQAYLAYFGRPADVSGLSFYADKTEASVVAAFSASTESQAFFGSLNTLAQINTIYQNLFNRPAEPAGLTYWAGEINAGRLSLAQASMGILAGAQNDDKLAVTNKLAAANAFTAALDTSDEMIGYQGTSVITSARAYLASVGSTAASLTAATATAALNASVATVVAAGVAGASSSTGSAFTLTTNIETFTGTTGNDTFNATHLTFNASDVLVGGTGTDSLTIVNTGASGLTIPAASVTGIENISIRNLNTGTVTAAVTAVAQVNTVSVPVPAAAINTVTVNYGGVTTTVVTGATSTTSGTAVTAAINQAAGATIAAFTAGGDAANTAGSIVITAPTAGTALPAITFGSSAAGIQPTTTFTTANTVGVTAITGTDTVTASNFSGATSFASDASTGALTLTALTAAQSANITNGGSAAFTAGYGATVAAGTVNVSGGTTAGAVAMNGAALQTLNISSSGAVNTLGAISTDSAVVTAVNLTANTAILTTGLTVANAGAIAAVALNISGAAGDRSASATSAARSAVTLGTLDTDFTSINASGLTAGGVSATLSATTTATFTGGAGSDRVTTSTSGQLGAVNAGAGTDTLTLAATAHMDTAAEGALYTGFEVLAVADNVTIDLDTFTGSTITSVSIADAANATSVTDMSAAQAASLAITAGAGALTLGVKDAATVGTANTLNITVSDGDTTTSEAVWGTGDVTLAGVETINITATDDVTFATMANISGLATLTVTGAGDVSLTTNTMALTNNTTISTSAVTGTVVIDASGATGFGAAITGSASNTNTLTGTVLADVITGGANVDSIFNRLTGGTATAGDTIVTGAGFDTVTLIGAVAAATSTNYDAAARITDFTVGTAANNTDLIRFDDANTDYLEVGASEGLACVATAEAAACAVVVQSVAQNAGAAAGATGGEFFKLTTGVAFTTDIQTTFNLAIGTSTVTTLASNGVYAVSYYDTTNSRMVILGADITAGTSTVLETGDVIFLIGTINMSAADYALIDADNFAAFV